MNDPFRHLFEQDGVIVQPLPDGSRMFVINEPEKVMGRLPQWIKEALAKMQAIASERYLRSVQSSCSMMDMRHQNPPGVVFHFEGQERIQETGTQIILASGGGMAVELLDFSILTHLVAGEEPNRLMRLHCAGTFKSRQRIMRRVHQLIAEHAHQIETAS